MRIVLIGPPGSGKGTQANWLSQYYNIPHLSTGDMLRKKLTDSSFLSQEIRETLQEGSLVSDELVMKLIQERIIQPDAQKGFILDGFPRTLKQVELLNATAISIQHVIEFTVSDASIIQRFSGRRIHPTSGRIYHIHHSPPEIEGQDDLTSEPLIKRTDDNETTIKKRLAIYYDKTQPVSQYYQNWASRKESLAPKYYTLAADEPIQVIQNRLAKLIEQGI